jgi:hypothetical protein
MGILGLSFGKQSSKSKTDTTQNQVTNQSQTQNSSQNTSSNTNSSNTSQGSSTTNQSGTQTTTGTKTNTGTGTTSLFGQNVLAALEQSALSLLPQNSPAAMTPTNFDGDAFVSDIMKSTGAQLQTGLDITRGGVQDMIGAGRENSSMGSLLLNRAEADASAALAGARGQAESTAAGIINQMNQTSLAANQQGNARADSVGAQGRHADYHAGWHRIVERYGEHDEHRHDEHERVEQSAVLDRSVDRAGVAVAPEWDDEHHRESVDQGQRHSDRRQSQSREVSHVRHPRRFQQDARRRVGQPAEES